MLSVSYFFPTSWFGSTICQVFHGISDSFSSLIHFYFYSLHVCLSFFLPGSVQVSKRASVRNLFAPSHMLLKQVCIKLQHYAKKTKLTENPVYSARTVHMAASSILNHREEAHRHTLQNKYLLIWTYG